MFHRGLVIVAIFTVLLSDTLLFHSARAQTQSSIATTISISTTPKIPGPLEVVTFEVKSYSVDLDRSEISWSVNGKSGLSGLGEKKFTAKAGPAGSTTTISVIITMPNLQKIEKIVLLQPVSIDLLVQSANGYVPPFYEGRALPTRESTMRIVALPAVKNASGKTLVPADFVFTWKRNDKTIQTSSGYGKNTLIFKKNYLDPNESVTVSAEGVKENYAVEKAVSLPTYNPKILFYEHDPLRGMRFDQAITGSFSLGKEEKSLIAIPYFFSTSDAVAPILSYEWRLSNKALPTPDIKNILSLKSGGAKGSAPLTLDIENSKLLFETGKVSTTINLD